MDNARNKKVKKMTENEKLIAIALIVGLACFIAGFLIGETFAVVSFISVAAAIDIDEMNIDLNESQMVDRMIEYLNDTGQLYG